MLKQLSILEVKKGERAYQLSLDAESPLGEVHDVLYQMLGFVLSKMQAAVKPEAEEVPCQDSPS